MFVEGDSPSALGESPSRCGLKWELADREPIGRSLAHGRSFEGDLQMMHSKILRIMLALSSVTILAAFTGGCATKGYVNDRVAEASAKEASEHSAMRGDISRLDSSVTQAGTSAQSADAAAARARMMALGHVDYRTAQEFGVPFEYDSAELGLDARLTLDQVASAVREHPNYIVDLVGHACSTGPAAYNDELSRRRANAVLSYLVQNGPGPVGRYAVVGLGEATPVLAGESEDHIASRRVQVVVLEKVDSGTGDATKEPVISQVDTN